MDEAGFCLWSPVSYSGASNQGTEILEQVPRRGNRISIWGLWQPGEHFDYAQALGGFDGESYIKVMDWVAQKAAITLEQTGRLTVIVLAFGSLHKRDLVQQQWRRSSAQGLFMFFLPPYCSDMNRIEDQWHQLKTHELVGRMFD